MENLKIINDAICNLEIRLVNCENEGAKRDLKEQIENLKLILVDLENYNDIKMALKKIVD